MNYPQSFDDPTTIPNNRIVGGPDPAGDNNAQASALLAVERAIGSNTMPDPRSIKDRISALETISPLINYYGFDIPYEGVQGWGSLTAAVLQRDTGQVYKGVASLKVSVPGVSGGTFLSVSGLSGTTILRFWVLGDTVSAGSIVYGQLADSSSGGGTQLSVPVVLSSTVWKEIVVILPILGTSVTASMILTSLGGMNMWIDAISIGTVTTPVVTTAGRRVLKNGLPIRWRGVNYSNIPIGLSPGVPWGAEAKQCRYDLEDIAAGGFDCIKLYADTPHSTQQYGAFLDECYRNGIDVWMYYYVPQSTDYSVATGNVNRLNAIASYRAAVSWVRYHPCIVGYGFGNEMNYNLSGTPEADFYSLLELASSLVKLDDPTRITTTANGDVGQIATYDATLPHLDVWGATLYRGQTLSGVEATVTLGTSKPLLVAEYGYDRFNHNALGGPAEDQTGQASRDLSLTRELDSWPIVCARFLFEWADEWWKESLAGDTLTTHDHVGVLNYNDDRDFTFDEEWFGITEALNPGSGQQRVKKATYTALQAYHAASPKENSLNDGVASATLVTSKPGGFPMRDGANNLYWINVGVSNGTPSLLISAYYVLSPESTVNPIWHVDAANVVTANAPLVDTWNDTSGYNHGAVQYNTSNRPTLISSAVNSLPALRFSGSGQFMDVNNFITGGNVTMFIVAANQHVTLSNSSIDTLVSTMKSGGTAGGIACATFNGYGNATQRQFSADYTGGGASSLWVNGSTTLLLTLGGWNVLTYQASSVTARNFFRIGLYADGTNNGINDIAEIIMYQGILTTTARQAIEASLKAKYNTP